LGHALPHFGLLEIRRDIRVTSLSIAITHEARLRSGVLETTATRALLDSDEDGQISDPEMQEFLRDIAQHLAADYVIQASRRGPRETRESMAPEPLEITVATTTATLSPPGFRQMIQAPFPAYLIPPLQAGQPAGSALALNIMDPFFMVRIRNLPSAVWPEDTPRPASRLEVPDPTLETTPPPGPVSHELSLPVKLIRRPNPSSSEGAN
jgi:hypothetical protein